MTDQTNPAIPVVVHLSGPLPQRRSATASIARATEATPSGDAWPCSWAPCRRRLSTGGHIAPLATRGIVGQATGAFVVYDAETTRGGSGGPVLSLDGRVLAVTVGILPEFGGSNLGIPADEARRLLALAADSVSLSAREEGGEEGAEVPRPPLQPAGHRDSLPGHERD